MSGPWSNVYNLPMTKEKKENDLYQSMLALSVGVATKNWVVYHNMRPKIKKNTIIYIQLLLFTFQESKLIKQVIAVLGATLSGC